MCNVGRKNLGGARRRAENPTARDGGQSEARKARANANILSRGLPRARKGVESGTCLGAALWDLSERIISEKLGEDALTDWNLSV